MEEQIGWLLLTVFYLPQLAPETDATSPADLPWQTKDSFKSDYARAKQSAIELACRIEKASPTFLDNLAILESAFIERCSFLYKMVKKPNKKVVDGGFHNICRSLL
jgi:hypothetical protein